MKLTTDRVVEGRQFGKPTPQIGVSCCRFSGRLVKLIPPSARIQPGGNSASNPSRRLVRDREDRTDVDFAKHVIINSAATCGAEHKIRVPDNW